MRHYHLKTLCLLLLLLGTVATAGAYDFVSNGIYYNITNSTNKTVEVTYKDTNYNSYSGSVSIPSTVTNSGTTYSVTSIGSYAFQDCSGMTNVHIASTITSIGYAAFRRCAGLTSVTVPNSVTTIGSYAFTSCSNLKNVTIGGDIACACTSIGSWAFAACTALGNSDGSGSITCMALTPPTVTETTFGARDVQWGLNDYISAVERYAKLYTPYSATNTYKSSSSGWRYFYNANNPRWEFYTYPYYYILSGENTAYITHQGETVNDYVQTYNNFSNSFVFLPSSVNFNGKTYTVDGLYGAFYGCDAYDDVTIPDTYTYIGPSSFEGCTRLNQINIPEGVTYIGYKAFKNTALTDIVIPSTVTEIGLGAFATTTGTSPITSVTCLATTPPYVYQVINKSGQLNYWYEYDVWNGETYSNAPLNVPKGCKSAYQSAYDWSDFSNIYENAYDFEVNGIYYNITNSSTNTVTVTYRDTRYNSYSGNVYIPNTVSYNGTTYTVTTIGAHAFRGCTELTYVNIPNGITLIGYCAFYNCPALEAVTVPNSVTTIGNYAFYACRSLKTVAIGTDISCACTSIGNYAFAGCTALGNSDGSGSFTCMALTPPTVSEYTFGSHDVQWGLDDYISAVERYAKLYTPYSATNTYNSSTNRWRYFYNANNPRWEFYKYPYRYIISGENTVYITHIGKTVNDYTVSYNNASATLPTSVTFNNKTYTVNGLYGAFYGCYALENVTIPDTYTYIGPSSFEGCTNLTQINIPEGVTYVGYKSFMNTGLTNVVIPSTVTEIGLGAFATTTGTSPITSVTCLATTPPYVYQVINKSDQLNYWYEYDVWNGETYSNAPLYVPRGCKSAYQSAYDWKDFSTIIELEGDEHYGITVSGVEVSVSNCNDVLGDGTVSYNPETHTLTLNNATITTSASTGITVNETFVGDMCYINLVGVNHLNISTYYSVAVRKATTITGSGTLDMGTASTGTIYIRFGAPLIIDGGCTIKGNSIEGRSQSEMLTVQGAQTKVELSYTIYGLASLTLNDGLTITKPEGGYYDASSGWMKNANGTNCTSGVIIENPIKPGDVNGDGDVTIADVSGLIDLLLEGTGPYPPGADVNGDNDVTIADVSALIDMLLGI